jgi:hypothetical protein
MVRTIRTRWWVLCFVQVLVSAVALGAEPAGRWSAEKANAWGREKPWLVGCNFTPSSAINQLEMWQSETFDTRTINRELGWAQDLGFTSVRVFLHHIAWQHDPEGFLRRMEQFLQIADKHGIGVMFVPLDACWDPYPSAGRQRMPARHVHNSGWVQCPGAEILRDPQRHDELEGYIKGVMTRFKDDRRVYVWDLFNEPDNTNKSSYDRKELPNKAEMSLLLIQKAFAWAREVGVAQPITSGVWVGNWGDPAKLSAMERVQLEQSDVISFHSYAKLDEVKTCVANLRRYGRPILCTEYMARPNGSRFDPILGYFKEQHVAAYNWGFVAGKTQTQYPWDSWTKSYNAPPPLWFHEILNRNGTPYIAEEVDYIKHVTGAAERQSHPTTQALAPAAP